MGVAASSIHRESGHGGYHGAQGQMSSGGDVIRRCNCYSINLDIKCYRHSLTFRTQNSSETSTSKSRPRFKKKRNYGFATFKKKLIGKRRDCKGSDHGRCFRDHFVDCPSTVLKSLSSHYEALILMKDLSFQANLARPPAQTLRQCLSELLTSGACSDIVMCYDGHRFPVHKHILMARCRYFNCHLSLVPDAKNFQLCTSTGIVSSATVKRILTYIYTGKVDLPSDLTAENKTSLAFFEEEFGILNSLESDIAFLGEAFYADCKLIFCRPETIGFEKRSHSNLELTCHQTILACRSGFFRKLLEKRKKQKQDRNAIVEIHLDEDIIPAKYGRVLIHAAYRDVLDMRLVSFDHGRDAVSVHNHLNDSNTELNAEEEAALQDVMNLYEIGKFLEFNFLSQCCEDLLMQMMRTQNVVKILTWGLEPQSSEWIARQAYQHLEEEFYNFASDTKLLSMLNQEVLVRILRSDFTQASESEMLQALIRWGEHQLTRKDYRACVSTQTSSRKNAKRRDTCDGELKDLLAPLLQHLRIQHILPRDRASDVMDMAIARNLFPFHPDFASQSSSVTKFAPWDPTNAGDCYVRPRLFLPYFEECKNLIEERCAQDPEIISSSVPVVADPDFAKCTLRDKAGETLQCGVTTLEQDTSRLPDKEMISRMAERLEKLLSSAPVQRALSFPSINRKEIFRLVELRVVREYNLSDSYTSILHNVRGRYVTNIHQDHQSAVETGMSKRGFHMSLAGSRIQEKEKPANEVGVVQRGVLIHPPLSTRTSRVPDVTLATNTFCEFSSVRLTAGQESPDLVTVEDGCNSGDQTTSTINRITSSKFADKSSTMGKKTNSSKSSGSSLSGSWKRNVYSVVGHACKRQSDSSHRNRLSNGKANSSSRQSLKSCRLMWDPSSL